MTTGHIVLENTRRPLAILKRECSMMIQQMLKKEKEKQECTTIETTHDNSRGIKGQPQGQKYGKEQGFRGRHISVLIPAHFAY